MSAFITVVAVQPDRSGSLIERTVYVKADSVICFERTVINLPGLNAPVGVTLLTTIGAIDMCIKITCKETPEVIEAKINKSLQWRPI